jgi:hypothetical protein
MTFQLFSASFLKASSLAGFAVASSSVLSIGMVFAPLPSRAMFALISDSVSPVFVQPAPGSTPENPLLPQVVNDAFLFSSIPVQPNTRIWFDPIIAIGYDYAVTGGPLFSSVVAPTGINASNTFDLIYGSTNVSITGGVPYNFTSSQSNFSIQGIDVAANLDPANATAFVTGLTFDSAGTVNVTQTPITFNTSAVPGPLPLLGIGTAFAWSRKLRLRIKSSKSEVISMTTI